MKKQKTHPSFIRCQKCMEEIKIIDGKGIGHELPCVNEEAHDFRFSHYEQEGISTTAGLAKIAVSVCRRCGIVVKIDFF